MRGIESYHYLVLYCSGCTPFPIAVLPVANRPGAAMLVVKLLGQFNVQLNDQLIEIPSRPAQTLFAYLALQPGTAFRREKLAGLIWPDANEANARSNLRHALWRIRKALGDEEGPHYFPADDLTLAFSPAPGCWIDAVV